MPDSPSDAPLSDDTAVPTDEASIDHAAIALYAAIIPRRPLMIGAWPED